MGDVSKEGDDEAAPSTSLLPNGSKSPCQQENVQLPIELDEPLDSDELAAPPSPTSERYLAKTKLLHEKCSYISQQTDKMRHRVYSMRKECLRQRRMIRILCNCLDDRGDPWYKQTLQISDDDYAGLPLPVQQREVVAALPPPPVEEEPPKKKIRPKHRNPRLDEQRIAEQKAADERARQKIVSIIDSVYSETYHKNATDSANNNPLTSSGSSIELPSETTSALRTARDHSPTAPTLSKVMPDKVGDSSKQLETSNGATKNKRTSSFNREQEQTTSASQLSRSTDDPGENHDNGIQELQNYNSTTSQEDSEKSANVAGDAATLPAVTEEAKPTTDEPPMFISYRKVELDPKDIPKNIVIIQPMDPQFSFESLVSSAIKPSKLNSGEQVNSDEKEDVLGAVPFIFNPAEAQDEAKTESSEFTSRRLRSSDKVDRDGNDGDNGKMATRRSKRIRAHQVGDPQTAEPPAADVPL